MVEDPSDQSDGSYDDQRMRSSSRGDDASGSGDESSNSTNAMRSDLSVGGSVSSSKVRRSKHGKDK